MGNPHTRYSTIAAQLNIPPLGLAVMYINMLKINVGYVTQ